VALGGKRVVHGGNGLISGETAGAAGKANAAAALRRARERSFLTTEITGEMRA
jgi:hypothetical protein